MPRGRLTRYRVEDGWLVLDQGMLQTRILRLTSEEVTLTSGRLRRFLPTELEHRLITHPSDHEEVGIMVDWIDGVLAGAWNLDLQDFDAEVIFSFENVVDFTKAMVIL